MPFDNINFFDSQSVFSLCLPIFQNLWQDLRNTYAMYVDST